MGSKGFSLIEMLVAVGIMGVVAVSFATMIANQNKEITRSAVRLETFAIADEIKNILADPANCTATFAGKGNGDSVSLLKKASTNTFPTGTMFGASGLVIDSYTLTNATAGLQPTEYELQIKFSKGPDSGFSFLRTIRLNVASNAAVVTDGITPPGTVNTCQSGGSIASSINTAEDVCDAIGGVYDTVTSKCKLKPTLEIDNTKSACDPSRKGQMKFADGDEYDSGRTPKLYICDGRTWRFITTELACEASSTTTAVMGEYDGWLSYAPGIPRQGCGTQYTTADKRILGRSSTWSNSDLDNTAMIISNLESSHETLRNKQIMYWSFPGCSSSPSGSSITSRTLSFNANCVITQEGLFNIADTGGNTRYMKLRFNCGASYLSSIQLLGCRDTAAAAWAIP